MGMSEKGMGIEGRRKTRCKAEERGAGRRKKGEGKVILKERKEEKEREGKGRGEVMEGD